MLANELRGRAKLDQLESRSDLGTVTGERPLRSRQEKAPGLPMWGLGEVLSSQSVLGAGNSN